METLSSTVPRVFVLGSLCLHLSQMLLAVCRKRAWSLSLRVWSAWVMREEDLSMHCLQPAICCASFLSLIAWAKKGDIQIYLLLEEPPVSVQFVNLPDTRLESNLLHSFDNQNLWPYSAKLVLDVYLRYTLNSAVSVGRSSWTGLAAKSKFTTFHKWWGKEGERAGLISLSW